MLGCAAREHAAAVVRGVPFCECCALNCWWLDSVFLYEMGPDDDLMVLGQDMFL
jgi:hypothetical protein